MSNSIKSEPSCAKYSANKAWKKWIVPSEDSTAAWSVYGQAMLGNPALSGLSHRHSPEYVGFLATIQ